jgi:hypothetical protein
MNFDDDFRDLERKHRDWSWLKKTSLVCLAILIVIGAFLLLRPDPKPKSPSGSTPQTQSKKSNSSSKTAALGASTNNASPPTPPTQPITLPETYSAKKDIVTTGSTTSYSVDDSQGNTYYIIKQPALATLDIGSFEAKLTNSEKISVPTGTAVIGENRGQLVASIRTPDQSTWILITTPELSNRTGLETLAKAIKLG